MIVPKYLRYCLFIPRISGTHLFDLQGQLKYSQLAVLILLFCCFTFRVFDEFQTSKHRLHDLIRLPCMVFIGCTLMSFFLPIWQKKRLKKALEGIETVSNYVKVIKIKSYVYPFVFSSMFVTIFAIQRSFTVKYCVYPISMVLMNAFSDEFSLILGLFDSLFEALTAKLENIISRDDIDSILKVHDSLRSALRRINHLYSVQLLMIIALSFYGSTVYAYTLIRAATFYKVVPRIVIILWLIVYIQLSLKILLSASSLKEQINTFDRELYEILKNRPKCWTQLVKLEDLLIERKVGLTAAGFFELSIETIGNMIYSGATYLVIILQME